MSCRAGQDDGTSKSKVYPTYDHLPTPVYSSKLIVYSVMTHEKEASYTSIVLHCSRCIVHIIAAYFMVDFNSHNVYFNFE